MTQPPRTWTLLGADGSPYESPAPGTLGGNAKDRIYGRLDCGSALAALRRGGYAEHRVFFADAETARAAGLSALRHLPARRVRRVEGQPGLS